MTATLRPFVLRFPLRKIKNPSMAMSWLVSQIFQVLLNKHSDLNSYNYHYKHKYNYK